MIIWEGKALTKLHNFPRYSNDLERRKQKYITGRHSTSDPMFYFGYKLLNRAWNYQKENTYDEAEQERRNRCDGMFWRYDLWVCIRMHVRVLSLFYIFTIGIISESKNSFLRVEWLENLEGSSWCQPRFSLCLSYEINTCSSAKAQQN